MPLEISEIAVRLAVGDVTPASTPSGDHRGGGEPPSVPEETIREIVRACADEVLRVLAQVEER